MMPTPAKMDQPSRLCKKVTDRMICRGADQTMFIYVVMSWNFVASTDIRLTMSPDENFVFPLLLRRSIWK